MKLHELLAVRRFLKLLGRRTSQLLNGSDDAIKNGVYFHDIIIGKHYGFDSGLSE